MCRALFVAASLLAVAVAPIVPGASAAPPAGYEYLQLENHAVETFRVPAAKFAAPYAIAEGSTGDMWWVEDGGNVGQLSPNGKVVTRGRPFPISGETDLVRTRDGSLWYTVNQGVAVRSPSGSVSLITIPAPPGCVPEPCRNVSPLEIATTPDGAVWTYGNPGLFGAVARIDPSTRAVRTFHIGDVVEPPGQRVVVRGLASDASGSIWFGVQRQTFLDGVSQPTGALGRIAPDGTLSMLPARHQTFSAPSTVTRGPDGLIWYVVDGPRGSAPWMGRFSPAGVAADIPMRDGPGWTLETGPDGRVWFPALDGLHAMSPTGAQRIYDTGDEVERVQELTVSARGDIWFTAVNDRIGRVVLRSPKVVKVVAPGRTKRGSRPIVVVTTDGPIRASVSARLGRRQLGRALREQLLEGRNQVRLPRAFTTRVGAIQVTLEGRGVSKTVSLRVTP